jgi:hypothetical protein
MGASGSSGGSFFNTKEGPIEKIGWSGGRSLKGGGIHRIVTVRVGDDDPLLGGLPLGVAEHGQPPVVARLHDAQPHLPQLVVRLIADHHDAFVGDPVDDVRGCLRGERNMHGQRVERLCLRVDIYGAVDGVPSSGPFGVTGFSS